MKEFLVLIFFKSYVSYSHTQIIEKNYTLHLNYFIASGEFGGTNEGLIIYWDGDSIKAKSIRYKSSSYGKALGIDTIIDFYEQNRNNYTEIKEEWILSKKERDFIANVLNEIKARPLEKNVFSNASENYMILTKNEHYVFIDRAGNWNKFLGIKKVLNIEQRPKKL